MPLYEYKCDACGHRFEIIQKFSDPPVEKCPVCGGVVQKLQSAPAFQFKGSGWYVTDYARKDQPAEAKTDGGAPAESSSDRKEDAGKSEGKKDKETKAAPEKAAHADRSAASGTTSESPKAPPQKDS